MVDAKAQNIEYSEQNIEYRIEYSEHNIEYNGNIITKKLRRDEQNLKTKYF